MEAGEVAFQRRRTALFQIAHGGVPVEAGYAEREVVYDSNRAFAVQRHERPGVAEAHDAARLLLAHHREAEHLLIEIDRTLQVRDLKAHVVDGGGFEIEVLLRGSGGATGRQQRKATNQIATAE